MNYRDGCAPWKTIGASIKPGSDCASCCSPACAPANCAWRHRISSISNAGCGSSPPGNVKQLQRKLRKTRKGEDIPPYIVPLSRQAMEVVRELLRVAMPSQRYLLRHREDPRRYLCESTLNKALKRMGYQNRLTVHGLRATFSTAFNEIGYPAAWIEAQLSHSDPNVIRAAYNHAEYVEQRRRMMQDLADRLDLCEQGRVEEAHRHLGVHLESVPRPAMPNYVSPHFSHAA